MVAIPGGQQDVKVMLKYTQEEMLSRWKSEPKLPDVMSHLFAPYQTGKKPWDESAINLMAGESHLLINAGSPDFSDTTRTTLACALFELTKQPEYIRKLRQELDPFYPGPVMNSQTAKSPTLIFSMASSGKLFACPAQPQSPHENESIYPRASEFIPERWYSSPELVRDNKATVPFSIGPYDCIGKPLSMMNIRVTLARILKRYDLSYAPDRADPQAEFVDMSDHFTLQAGPLYLRLEGRQ
ncbi:Cytochrome P450 [Cordyceps fumosorosea ARSEF 2679]|uniref:Cytochrome P450 n=1 Tax=Cordyceps fumosorosea (strain ARSEF 2679) TaxID=1081104 RepID=A0A168BS76_CORFA|nr:Cytochrome P450 [Cordyceps fumosorosea ARSEF 2679]OAA70480.1 Cytochrome P450 [Cordyceps fumosorosea ARSEF 2679]